MFARLQFVLFCVDKCCFFIGNLLKCTVCFIVIFKPHKATKNILIFVTVLLQKYTVFRSCVGFVCCVGGGATI